MVRILDPQGGTSFYDPTCGSGGMLIREMSMPSSTAGRAFVSMAKKTMVRSGRSAG